MLDQVMFDIKILEVKQLNVEEAGREIREKISVNEQMIVIAKSHIVESFQSNTTSLISSVQSSQEALSISSSNTTDEYALSISWHNAAVEAIWGLVSAGILIPTSSEFIETDRSVYFESTSGNRMASRTEFGNINLQGTQLTTYKSFRLRRSGVTENNFVLSNTDVYLNKMHTGSLSEHINTDLRECIACFRTENYLASLTMLGRAVEGAWVNLGMALADSANTDSTSNALNNSMKNENQSLSKKMKTVLNNYKKDDEFKDIWTKSSVFPRNLEEVHNWSDMVRDARNSIHWGAEPVIPNNYEKIAIYLMCAIPNIAAISKIMEACE